MPSHFTNRRLYWPWPQDVGHSGLEMSWFETEQRAIERLIKDSWDAVATTATPAVGDESIKAETAAGKSVFTAESGIWAADQTPTDAAHDGRCDTAAYIVDAPDIISIDMPKVRLFRSWKTMQLQIVDGSRTLQDETLLYSRL